MLLLSSSFYLVKDYVINPASALVKRCIEGLTPSYLRELCCSTTQVQRRCYPRSVAHAELIVSKLADCQAAPCLLCAAPVTWNGLTYSTLCQTPVGDYTSFFSTLKTVVFDRCLAGSTPK